MKRALRNVPSVEKMVQAIGDTGLPRRLVVAVVRRELARVRSAATIPAPEVVREQLRQSLVRVERSRLQPVINATGVLLHTNLGRAPLGPGVLAALTRIGGVYCSLELDLETGDRGSRGTYAEQALALLSGAEAATVANNCAAALILILRHFTRGDRKQVVISRGELVQIGGGFRIPEILETSGAELREVGTTNRTTLGDYARAIGSRTALMLRVHRSNFFMGGFVESPSRAELSALARRKHLPFVEDLGSGAATTIEPFTGPAGNEPSPAEVIKGGADLVCFSGDKLLGGPQAGIIAGRRAAVERLKRDPFFRALRCDKLILAAMEATADLHLARSTQDPNGASPPGEFPLFDLVGTPAESLRRRAQAVGESLKGLPFRWRVSDTEARLGGGTLPRAVLPSAALDLQSDDLPLKSIATALRGASPAVISCLAGGWCRLDFRTVFPPQDPALAQAIRTALG